MPPDGKALGRPRRQGSPYFFREKNVVESAYFALFCSVFGCFGLFCPLFVLFCLVLLKMSSKFDVKKSMRITPLAGKKEKYVKFENYKNRTKNKIKLHFKENDFLEVMLAVQPLTKNWSTVF